MTHDGISDVIITFASRVAVGPPVDCSHSDWEAPPPFSNTQNHSYVVQLKYENCNNKYFKRLQLEWSLLTADASGWLYDVWAETVGVVMGNDLVRLKSPALRLLKLLTINFV